MKKIDRLIIVASAVLLLAAEPLHSAPEGRPPNLIVIMADDMDYSDLGSYGGEIQTPNLDGLAENGLRFTHFYNTGQCVPTRGSLLTGLYPHQAGLGGMVHDQGEPGVSRTVGRSRGDHRRGAW